MEEISPLLNLITVERTAEINVFDSLDFLDLKFLHPAGLIPVHRLV